VRNGEVEFYRTWTQYARIQANYRLQTISIDLFIDNFLKSNAVNLVIKCYALAKISRIFHCRILIWATLYTRPIEVECISYVKDHFLQDQDQDHSQNLRPIMPTKSGTIPFQRD